MPTFRRRWRFWRHPDKKKNDGNTVPNEAPPEPGPRTPSSALHAQAEPEPAAESSTRADSVDAAHFAPTFSPVGTDLTRSRSLWLRAEDEMINGTDTEKKKLIEAFFQSLKEEWAAGRSAPAEAATGSLTRQEQMRDLLAVKVDELNGKSHKAQRGNWGVAAGKLFTTVLSFIVTAKDLISTVGGGDPHVALACAGASVILSLLTQHAEQHEALLSGLETVAKLICQYPLVEHAYQERAKNPALSAEQARRVETEFEGSLVQLYTLILEFQARAVLYLQRGRLRQFVQDTVAWNDWKDLERRLSRADAHCRSFKDLINNEKLHHDIDKMQMKVSDISERMQQLIDLHTNQVATAQREKEVRCLQKLFHSTCPYQARKDRNPDRVSGTCEWFQSHGHFKHWKDTPGSRLLWVSADPGCGKSVLVKFLVDHALKTAGSRTTCYFFFKDDFEDQKSATSALCAILHQLFVQNEKLSRKALLEKWDAHGDAFFKQFELLWDVLVRAAGDANAGDVTVIMDALDECGADDLRSLTGAIEKLYAPGAPDANLKFLFTSRPYERIDRQFRPIHRSGPCIRLAGEDEEEAEQITAEIGLVIRDRVQAISIEMDLEPDEEQFLGAELMSVENRTYLWVMLTLDVIRNSPTFTKGTVRQALQNLPTSVETAYERILAHTTDAEKAKKLLQIILAAVRPLTLQEIAVALDLTSTHKTIADLQAEMEPLARFRKTIRDLCGLVVTVVDSKVYLLHQTVKEFLIDPAARAPLSGWKYCLGLGPSHGILAAASMQLLLLDDFRTRPLDPFCKPEELEALFSELDAVDLLTYAATNWAEHLDTSCRFPASDDGEQRRQLLELGTRVCAMDLGGTPWPQVLHVLNQRDPATAHDEEGPSPAECWDWWPTDAEDYYRGMPALHVASHLGLKWLVQHLLTVHGADAKGPPDGDPLARTALHWACRSDNGACVSNLLRVSDDSTHINTMDRHECTPLHDACRGDLGRTTTFLLHLDADPETRGATHGITALHVAAAAGSTDALGALLDARDGINLNPRDRQGRTPLMYAAAGWQLAVVDMLVKAGADVEGRDEDGRTALLHVGGRRLRPPPRRKAFAWSAAQPLAHSVGEVFAEIGRTLRAARKEREKEEANRDPRVLERVEQLKVAIKLQCMRTCSFAEVMAILYDGKPTGIQVHLHLNGENHEVVDFEWFKKEFNFFRFDGVLRSVDLPAVTFTGDEVDDSSKENGRDDMVKAFNWVQSKGVTHILRVIVHDMVMPHHSDAAITKALQQFHVESLDWRKPDLGPEAICNISKELREVHLYWSGDMAVWEAWNSHESLGRLECLDTIYIHLAEGKDINNSTGLYEDARAWENKLNAQRSSEHAMEKATTESTARDTVRKLDRRPITVKVLDKNGEAQQAWNKFDPVFTQ